MSNNILQPYAADQCARLYRKFKGQSFPLGAIPADIKRASLRSNKIIERTISGEYRFTSRGVQVMRKRGLI
jgi:hypothetical protein